MMGAIYWGGLALSLLANAVGLLAVAKFVRARGGWQYVKSKLDGLGLVADKDREDFERAYYRNKTELHAAAPIGPADLVLLGDSLTDACAWHEWLGPHVKNRGISGDTVAGLAKRLAPIIAGRPRRILLMIGINDLLNGAEPGLLATQYEGVVTALRAGTPDSALAIQSLLPVDGRRWGVARAAAVVAFNERLRGIASAHGADFLDLFPLFAEGPNMALGLSYDGLHVNGAGYERWRAAITGLAAAPPG